MPDPPDEKIETGPNGEQVFVKGGRFFLNDPAAPGEFTHVPVSELERALADGADFASADAVRTRLRQRQNADIRSQESSTDALLEAAGRSAVDIPLTLPRLAGLDVPSDTAAHVVEGFGGRPVEEQLRSAEAFGEGALGASNVGSAAVDIALSLVGAGVASKALKGATMAQRLSALGAVDAATGGLGGGAAAAEGAFRNRESLSPDKLLASVGSGALLSLALGGASEAMGAGARWATGRLDALDPVAVGRGMEGAADLVKKGERILGRGGPSGGIRIRTPKGADTPGAGFGKLPNWRWKGQSVLSVADTLRSAGKKLTGDAGEKIASSEARAAALLDSAESEIKAARRASNTALREAETKFGRAQRSFRQAEARMARAARAAEKLDADVARAKGKTAAREAKLGRSSEKNQQKLAQRQEELARIDRQYERRLGQVDSQILEIDREMEELGGSSEPLNKAQRAQLARLQSRKALLDEDRSVLVDDHESGRNALAGEVETLESERARVAEELGGARERPAWKEVELSGKSRLQAEKDAAAEDLRIAQQALNDADAMRQQVLRNHEALSTNEEAIRAARAGEAEDIISQGRIDAKEAFRTSPLYRGAAYTIEGLTAARSAALRTVVQGTWLRDQATMEALDAQDEIERRIDAAMVTATTPGASASWTDKSGVGDYQNFPDMQFFRPGETRRESALARADEIARAASNPALMIENISASTESFHMLGPEVMAGLIDRQLKAVSFMNRFLNTRSLNNPLQPTQTEAPGIDELFIDSFERLWNGVMFPGLLIDEVATWTVTGETVQTSRYLYPELYASVQRKMADLVFSGEFEPDYDQRVQLSALLGVMDSSLQPEKMGDYDAIMAQAQMERDQAAAAISNKAPGRAAGDPTISQQMKTTSQRVAEN